MGWIARNIDGTAFLRRPRPVIEVDDRRKFIRDYDVPADVTTDRAKAHVFGTKKEAYANVEFAGDDWLIENVKTGQVISEADERSKRIAARLNSVASLYQFTPYKR